jgi:hypothetical protein
VVPDPVAWEPPLVVDEASGRPAGCVWWLLLAAALALPALVLALSLAVRAVGP